MKKLFSYVILLLMSTVFIIYGSNKKTSLPKGVEIFQLDNGIQVLLIQKNNIPMVGINTVVKVGSAYETFATSGMSHMLEHLLFNGTDRMTQKQLYDATDMIGGYNNANTSEYYTNFMMVTPAENIKEGMRLQSAMLFNSIIPDNKFEKEKGIVLEEIAKTLANPRAQAERNVNSIIYKGHALSLPTLGTYETIKKMKRDEVIKFYKNFYVPNNMIINVIGNFNKDEMIKWLKEFYGDATPGNVNYASDRNWSTGFQKPNNKKLDNVYNRFYKGQSTKLQVFYILPNGKNEEFFDLLKIALDKNTEFVKKDLTKNFKDDFINIKFSTIESPIKNLLEVNFTLKKEDNISELISSLSENLSKLQFTIPKEIVESEKIKSATSFFKNTEKPHMFGIFNADVLAKQGIESVLSSYSGGNYDKAFDELKEIKIKELYTSIVQHPFKKDKELKRKEATNIKLFDSDKTKPALIVKQAEGSNLLAVHYLLKYKSAFENKYGRNAAFILHDAFGQRMKSDEVKKKSLKYGFTFTVNDNPYIPMDNIYLDPSFGYIRAEGLATDVKGAISFLNSQFKNFSPTKKEFEKAKKKLSMVAMMARSNKAKKLFNSIVDKTLYKSIKYPTSKKKLTYDNLLLFGKEYFAPTNMIISVVSPENADVVFNDFKGFSSNKTLDNLKGLGYQKNYRLLNSPVKIDTNGNGEQAYLYFGFQKTILEKEKPELLALSLLLSDDIVFNIREKQGLAYRMSAGISTKGDKAIFYINMGTRPENVDKLIPQFPKLFNTDFADSITNEKLKKSVNMYLGRMMFRRLSSINQAYYLGHSLYFKGDINYDNKFLNALKNVTIYEVKKAAEKYLQLDNPLEIYVR